MPYCLLDDPVEDREEPYSEEDTDIHEEALLHGQVDVYQGRYLGS